MLCPKCGKEYEDNFCPNGCNSPYVQQLQRKKKKMRWWQILLVVTGAIIFIGIVTNIINQKDGSTYSSASMPSETKSRDLSSSTETNSTKSETSKISDTETKDNFIKSCKEYSYEDISRNPSNFKGKSAAFTGKVVQVQESGKDVVLRVNVTKGEYDIWDNAVYVEYTKQSINESRILEDDIVTLYGIMNGIKTYKTVLGSELSIPWVKCKYIEIKK